MAIKNIICRGIGFSPGSISYIPTLGFSVGEEVVEAEATWVALQPATDTYKTVQPVTDTYSTLQGATDSWKKLQ